MVKQNGGAHAIVGAVNSSTPQPKRPAPTHRDSGRAGAVHKSTICPVTEVMATLRKPARVFHLSTMMLLTLGALRECEATIRHVPTNYPAIQLALSASSPNDTILVAPGVYFENLNAGDKFVSIIGPGGADNTVVDGQAAGRCLRLGDGGRLSGLTFRNGYVSTDGGGIWVRVNDSTRPFEMDGCRLIENVVGFPDQGRGGGLYITCFVIGVKVTNCRFERNQAGLLGGGAYGCAGTLEDNVFIDNYAWHAGGGLDGGGEIARRNLFIGNTARNVGGGYYGSPRLLENNTFVNNHHQNVFSLGAGIHVKEGGVVKKNIVIGSTGIGNTGVGIYFNHSGMLEGTPELSCNDSWGNSGPNFYVAGMVDTVGHNNFSLDPQFCHPQSMNFSLGAASPCAGGYAGCGLIGALGVGCQPITVESATWSRIKTLLN